MGHQLRSMALAALGLLGACAGETKLYNAEIYIPYSPNEFGYGAGRRDLTTQIRGDPFAGDQAQFEAALLDTLNASRNFVQPTHFTTTPGESARPAYRAVFMFDAGPATPTAYCGQPLSVPVVVPEDKVRVVAAFCRNQGVLTTVTGEVRASGVDDPHFTDLMRQIVIHLFPPVDPTRDNNRLRPWLVRGGSSFDTTVGSLRLGG